MRFLLGLAVLAAAIYGLRFVYARFLSSSRPGQARRKNASRSGETETMIRCQQCGTYIPASEAIPSESDMVFCSDDHRRRYFSRR